MSIEKYDYEIVNGRKIRVRPRETVSEIDVNGYFRRQPNHFTTPFGDGENDLKAEGNQRYRLIWAKLCHWSNRASIVRELEGLEDQISVNMVSQAHHEKNLGWEYVYNENNVDPVLGDQFLSEAYYRADEDYQGRTTVPALIDTKTGKVVKETYSDESLELMRDFCMCSRDLAIIDILSSTGMRVGELVKLDRDDIDFEKKLEESLKDL